MTSTGRLEGIFTPNITPVDASGAIHEKRLREYIDWLIANGVHGLYPCGSTGEFTRFTPEERRRVIEICVDQVAGRVPILAGAAEANAKETLKTCEYYAKLGVKAVAIVAPFYYKISPGSVYEYFKEIGDHTAVDVTLYNIPMFAAPIDVPTITRLAEECPRITGIKDSSGDVPNMMRMIAAVRPKRADFSFLTGWEAALVPMLLMGCDGGTNATSGVVPELTRKIYDACKANKLDEARTLQHQLLPIFDIMIGTGDFPGGFREGVRLRGFDMGETRQTIPASQKEELTKGREKLKKLLVEGGFIK